MMTETLHRLLPFLAVIGALSLAACGDSADDEKTEAPETVKEDALESPPADPTADFAATQRQFYDDYGARDGVASSDGGVHYSVLSEGDGESPALGDMVTVHYEGKLVDGTVFDSSYQRGEPATFPSDRLIVGWQQILPMMQVGDKWEIVIPSDLAYGSRGAGRAIPPDATLIFTMELLGVGGAQ